MCTTIGSQKDLDTLASDLETAFLTQPVPVFSDVVLLSTEGDKFPSCRGILASRSRFFEKLLFSDFKESSQHHVRISLCSRSLRKVLQYVYSGKFPFVDEGERENVLDLLDTLQAADFIDCNVMYSTIVHYLVSMARKCNWLICTVIEGLCSGTRGRDHTSAIVILMKCIQMNPRGSLFVPSCTCNTDGHRGALGITSGEFGAEGLGVLELSAQVLRKLILVDKGHGFFSHGADRLSDSYWFQVILFWVREAGRVFPGLEMSEEDVERRRREGIRIVALLNPKTMPLNFLLAEVEPSGLMSLQDLCMGYKERATESCVESMEMRGTLVATQIDLNKAMKDSSKRSRASALLDMVPRLRGVLSLTAFPIYPLSSVVPSCCFAVSATAAAYGSGSDQSFDSEGADSFDSETDDDRQGQLLE